MVRRMAMTEVTVKFVRESVAAILVNDSDDPAKAVWLPKSQIEVSEKADGILEITMPEWLAIKTGLV